jgi:enoyl-CoA hydratase
MIERERQGAVEVLRLSHGKASALDLEFCEAITAALREVEASDAQALVVTGTGSIFSAGVDLYRLTDGGDEYIARYFPALKDVLMTLFTFAKPFVAAVNGHAIAGGCLIAACADVRLMSGGRIGVPELHVGVPFPAVALEILNFAVGTRARELALRGANVDPNAAREMGLIDRVVEPDQLLPAAVDMATVLCTIPPETFALTKRQMRAESLARIERLSAFDDEARAIWSSPTIHARIREYLAKTVGKKP